MVQISARPKVTLSQTSRLFIDILYIAVVVIVRTINSRTKKNIFFFTQDIWDQNHVDYPEPCQTDPMLRFSISFLRYLAGSGSACCKCSDCTAGFGDSIELSKVVHVRMV